MAEEAERTEFEYAYPYGNFTVFFYGNRVYIGETEYPVGQCVVDVMNLNDTCLLEINRKMLDFVRAAEHMLEENTDGSAQEVQKKLAFALELVAELPVYRDLNIDWGASRCIIQVVRSDEELWWQIKRPETKERIAFDEAIRRIISVGEQLRLFRKQVSLMLEGYFEMSINSRKVVKINKKPEKKR